MAASHPLGVEEARRAVELRFAALFPDGGPRRVLDAGCGRQLPFRVPDSARIVGLDVSEDSLAGNDRVDERIVGNVETYPLEERAYDAAVCWWVLEHVSNPKAAIANLACCLRPAGVLVVAVPNFWSAKALITKLTPHRFHVWIYRRLLGYSAAGEPGHPPFKTYMRFAVAPSSLERLAAANGLLVVARIVYASGRERELPFRFGTLWRVFCWCARGVTFGRYDPELSEVVMLFRKSG